MNAERIDIVCDTLTYDIPDFRSFGRTSKCHLLPHLGAATVTQGAGRLGWGIIANNGESHPLIDEARDLDGLDRAAVVCLPALWEKVVAEGSASPTTVFQFGWSARHGEHVAFHYRAPDFVSEVRTESFSVTPAPTVAPEAAPTSLEEVIALIESIRSEHDPLVNDIFVGIGGDLILTHLDASGAYQRVIHSFPDDDEKWAARP